MIVNHILYLIFPWETNFSLYLKFLCFFIFTCINFTSSFFPCSLFLLLDCLFPISSFFFSSIAINLVCLFLFLLLLDFHSIGDSSLNQSFFLSVHWIYLFAYSFIFLSFLSLCSFLMRSHLRSFNPASFKC